MKNKKLFLPALLSVALVFSLILPASGVGASGTILLQEDFEDGQDQGWSHSGGGVITIEDDAGNKVYNLQGLHDGTQGFPAYTFYDGGADWSDYEVEFDVKLHEWDSMVLFNFRFLDWDNYYDLAIRTGDGSWWYGGRFQFSQTVGGVWSSWWIGAPVEVGTWYHIKISAIGDRIQLYFNGELKFDQTGFTIEKGKIGFWTCPWPGDPADWPIWSGGQLASYGHVHIDDIVVTTPSECAATATGSGTACFSTSSGTIEDLEALPSIPPDAPPGVTFPHGMFSFKITGLTPGEEVTLTVELPDPVPTGTKWWKYHNNTWSPMDIGDDDGDNVITVALQDGRTPDDEDSIAGQITDQGGPGSSGAVGWETYPISKMRVLLPWIALFIAAIASMSILMLRRRRS